MSNKMSKMVVGALFALLIVISFTMCLSSDVFTAYAYDKTNDDAVENTISVQEGANSLTNIHWENKTKALSDKDVQLFEKYDIDSNEALLATDVYVQEEVVEFDEVISRSMLPDDMMLPANIGDSQTTEEIHNKGYIKFTTTAYAIGFYDGGIVYHIEETVEQLKKFQIVHDDNLIIRHGNNSVTLNIDGYRAIGSLFTPRRMLQDGVGPVIQADINETLYPEFSCDAGAFYTFVASGIDVLVTAHYKVYGLSTIKGDYYMVATDTTSIQPVYVHNKDFFINSLSISFGPVGASINIDGDSVIMYGSEMTLKGYNGRIKTSVYNVRPNDYGFEPQYFFYEKSANHNINGFAFDTKRLRTGYIEEQYVNLSPNRNNAGLAYLEFDFQVPIYEISVYLSYWSASERYTLGVDSAYLQYMDKNGNWVTLLDILNGHLPTDRNTPKYFEYDIVEGTQKIRFIATKVTPNSDRNKGRICIGEMKFVHYEIV